jgi:FkbM family methyltransferase
MYLRYSPLNRGKGLIENFVVSTCIPDESKIDVRLPCGAKILMGAHEKIGRYLLIYKKFELEELLFCRQFVAPGSWAIDVGANIGIYTLTLSRLVAGSGGVIAIEPSPSNFHRLTTHIEGNSCTNVCALQVAAGRENGTATLNVDVDPAFGAAVSGGAADVRPGRTVSVNVRAIDNIWTELGCPKIGFIKIDVEGGEADVVLGAERVIQSCRPIVLIEATTENQLIELRRMFAKFNYVGRNPPGFQPWNFVFSAA